MAAFEEPWDLSGPISEGMWSYGDVPGPTAGIASFTRHFTTSHEAHGFETEAFGLASHTGTYIESSRHLVDSGRRLDQVPLSRFVLSATLVRFPGGLGPRDWVRADQLEAAAADLPRGDALLIDTGWGARWDDPAFLLDGPAYAPDCAEWIEGRRPRLLAVDVPFISSPRSGDPGTTILDTLFADDGLLLAPVRFDRVPPGAERSPLTLMAWPLAIEGACATPCRAILRSGRP